MSRYTVALLLLLGLSLTYVPGVSLITKDSVNQGTVPTPTPTRGPASPTPPPPTVVPLPTSPPPSPTPEPPAPTPDPNATAARATTMATVEFLPTAAPCSDNPTAQATDIVNVRQGPGTDYQTLDTLAYLEVRPIIGRAADATWWLIELQSGEVGWIFDSVVIAHGYIGGVPIVDAPSIRGQTPTPGTPWMPTAEPTCTLTPSATASATSSSTPTVDVAATESAATPSSLEVTTPPPATPTDASDVVESTIEPPSGDSVVSVTESTAALSTVAATAVLPTPTLAPLDTDDSIGTTDFLLYLGLLLLAAGAVLTFWRRKGGNDLE